MKKKKHLFLIGMFIPIFFIFLLVIVAGGTSSSADSFSSSAGSLNITSKDLASKANISEEKAQNVIDIANYLMSKERFSIQGASGALAVAERESGFDPKAENIGGGVAGIFQWSGWSNTVNGNRWSKAESRSLSMDVELKLMSAELNGAYKRTKDLVSVSTDPKQASLDWSQYYEGVALSDGQTKADKLQEDAQKWYDLLKEHVGFSNENGQSVNGVMSTDVPSGWSIDTAFSGQAYNGSGSYPQGQCTWYVYNRAYQLGIKFDSFMGNGGDWASKAGYSVSHELKLHTALSFVQGQAGSDPTYGHVAFVEQVKDDGSILISEMNVTGLPPLTVSYRTFSADEAKQFWYVEGK
ncbi:phage tail tip lysozyme [Lactococcus raffinolactis]|uniref:phage tail tip lysozyme n=1 Tax=Pseudolactococcus raffinolactis TaxID=1366 RepID=UPI0039A32528